MKNNAPFFWLRHIYFQMESKSKYSQKPASFNHRQIQSKKRHWKSGNKIDAGLKITKTLADSSIINYPPNINIASVQKPSFASGQKNVSLPKLSLEVHQFNTKVFSTNNQILPIIGRYEDDQRVYESVKDSINFDRKVQKLDAMVFEESEEEDKDWVLIQQAALFKMVSEQVASTKSVTILIANKQHKLPLEIIQISPTLNHIYNASKKFKERNGIILEIKEDEFIVILEHLNREYLHKQDLSMFRLFEIPAGMVFSILSHAQYLDLQSLIAICIKTIAKEFDRVETFEGVEDSIVLKILELKSIGELIYAEQYMVSQLDMTVLWISKLEKLSHIEVDTKDKYLMFKPKEYAKSLLLEFYISQVLGKVQKGLKIDIGRVLELEGGLINEFRLSIEDGCIELSIAFWKALFKYCKNIKKVVINVYRLNYSLVSILGACSLSYKNLEIVVNVQVCQKFDDRIVDNIKNLCNVPKLRKRKLIDTPKFICLKTENEFNLYGKGNNEIDTNTNSVDHIIQTTNPIAVNFIPGGSGYNVENLSNYLTSDYIIPHVQKLSFKNIKILTSHSLINLFEYNPMFSTMTELDISKTTLPACELLNLLQTITRLELKLTCLNLSSSIHDKHAGILKFMGQNIHKLNCLRELDLSFNVHTTIGIRQFMEGVINSNITKLNLSGMNLIDTTFTELFKFLNSRPFFKEIDLELEISDCQLTTRQINTIFSNLSKQIQNLNISKNRMSDQAISYLNDYFKESLLKNIDISFTIGCPGDIFLDSFCYCRNLESIKMQSMNLDDSFMKKLSELLVDLQLMNIKKVNVAGNDITEKGVVVLKNAIQKVHKRRKYTLGVNLNDNIVSGTLISKVQKYVSKYGWDGVCFIFGKQREYI
jgi:hypothetical protein